MFLKFSGFRATTATLILSAVVFSTVAAASVHRFTVTQSTGAEGADAFNNTSSTGGSLEGTIATAPDTSFAIPFGVLGEYNLGPQFGVGVAGLSSTGYGLVGETTGGTNASILAYSLGNTASGNDEAVEAIGKGTGDGLDAYSEVNGINAMAAYNQSTGSRGADAFYAENDVARETSIEAVDIGASNTSVGIFTKSKSGYPLIANTGGGGGQFAAGLSSNFTNGNLGGTANIGYDTGEAAKLSGGSGSSAHPVLAVSSSKAATDLINAAVSVGGTSQATSFLVQGSTQNRSGTVNASAGGDVQVQGDLYLTGSVYAGCNAFPSSSSTSCTALKSMIRSRSGGMVEAYQSNQTAPTVEDQGEAALINGNAHVVLNRVFASTISTTERYLVFTTPNADSRGLYVTNKTFNGFDVHENGGARSNLTFDYRIVAKALGSDADRMALYTPGNPKVRVSSRETAEPYLDSKAAHVAEAAMLKTPKKPTVLLDKLKLSNTR